MGRCKDKIKELERTRKISLSLIGNRRAAGRVIPEEERRRRGKAIALAHQKKDFGFKKGFDPWNKNKTGIYSKETLQKIGESKKGYHPKSEFKKGCNSWAKNLTKETDERIKKRGIKGGKTRKYLFSTGELVIWNKNKKTGCVSKNPEVTKKKQSEAMLGEKHWNWIDGRTKNKEHRYNQEKEWRKKNWERRYFFNDRRRARKMNAEGSYSFEEWLELKNRFNYMCLMCGQREPFLDQRCHTLSIDHAIPLSKGGTDYINNIQPLCLRCNLKKHTQIIFFKPESLLSCKF